MKRILAALLCMVMLCMCFVSCGKRSEDDLGPIFNAYLGAEPYVLDPQIDHTDDDAVQLMSLIYEGLTRINSKGKTEKALLDKYTYTKDAIRGEYILTMTIKNTKWTDAKDVTADDFVNSWQRLLSPDFSSSAASLLYDIKDAEKAKTGDILVDEIGLAAVDTYTIKVTFDHDVDVDQFLRKCASIALVPLRDDVISKSERSWSKNSTSMVANGPFAVKGLDYKQGTMRLERNPYYFLEEEDDLLKYVIPYRIYITFLKDNDAKPSGSSKAPESLSAQLSAFVENNIKVITDLPLAERTNYAKKGTLSDSASTLSLVINTKNPLFSDYRVRQALSAAIDRNEIVKLVTYAKIADSLINNTCFDGSTKKGFREVGGAVISTTADTTKAATLLSQANVISGQFTLSYRLTEEDEAVAKYLKSVWEPLGLTVKLEPLVATSYKEKNSTTENEDTFYDDDLTVKYNSGNYDIILIDYNMISVDPFAALACFAKNFSGNATSADIDWAVVGNACGFDDAKYNEIIDRAFAEKDTNKRAVILHEAEKHLLEQMPIIPLVYNQNFFMGADGISGAKFSFSGNVDLRKLKLKNYLDYYTTAE